MLVIPYKNALLLCIVFAFAHCEDKPKIIENISSTVVKAVGDTATLVCNINNPDDFSLLWVKKNKENPSDQTTLAFGTRLAFKTKKYLVTATQTTYSLEIKDIEYSDADEYQCVVSVSSTYKDVKSVEIKVQHPPNISKDIEVTPSPATLNGSVELKCAAEGYPEPNLSWKRAGDALLPAGGASYAGNILRISDISKQDRGVYYCIADNGIGQPAQRIVNFEVEFPPQISSPRPRVAQALGYNIELECKVEAYPAPQVSWYRDGHQINNEGGYSITNTASTNDVTISILVVSTVDSTQYGDYVCKASNKLGSAETKINLFDNPIPNINYSGLQWTSTGAKMQSQYMMYCVAVMLIALIL